MTKRELIALAQTIRDHNALPFSNTQFTSDQIRALADFCASTNPRFKRERWLGYIAGENGPNGGQLRTPPGHSHGCTSHQVSEDCECNAPGYRR
jgi:hypothetical protein